MFCGLNFAYEDGIKMKNKYFATVGTLYLSTETIIFSIFWIFNILQFAIDGKNNSKKSRKGVFLFFHVFLCGNDV
jgi:hypothetical protein